VKVVIHDRTEQAPARLRSYAERKLSRLSRHFDRVLQAEVEFACEGAHRQATAQVVRIVVHMDGRHGAVLKAREKAPELRPALDLALDKLDRQVVKLKEKIKKKARSPGGARVVAALPVPVTREKPPPERLRVKLRPESLAEAEAALESNGHLFRVFLDEDSGDIKVAYRRSDGSLAVIEPVVT
jgi:putative sigma-54 modulation protein